MRLKLYKRAKKRIAYYACGNWKNKGTAVYNSNEYIFSRISEILSNEKMIKTIVGNVNKERTNKINPAKKELEKIDKELEKLDKKNKIKTEV